MKFITNESLTDFGHTFVYRDSDDPSRMYGDSLGTIHQVGALYQIILFIRSPAITLDDAVLSPEVSETLWLGLVPFNRVTPIFRAFETLEARPF